MTEHRRHPRAPIALEVSYRRLNSFFVDYTRNVSAGGMFIRTSRPLPPGTRIAFHLGVPGQPEPLHLTGEVVHADGAAEGAGMGLRFVWEDEAARAAFENVVERLMVESLGTQTAAALLRKPVPSE